VTVKRAFWGMVAAAMTMATAPVVLVAQQEDGRGPLPVPAEAQQLIMEMQQIQDRLRPMQQEALRDPALQAAGDSLGARIREAMVEVEPATPELIDRLNDLMEELEAAQAAQDESRFQRAIGEATEIDQILQLAQAEAIELPDVASRLNAYESRIHDRMVADNPDAAGLLERLSALNVQLAAMMSRDP
jgi:hypothetical protein